MGLEKGILYGKEHRKPYRYAKAVSMSCRNHGGCPWCEGNRLHHRKKEDEAMRDHIKSYEKGEE